MKRTRAAGDRVRSLLHGGRPLVMGIVNVTPDSFSDGGEFDDSAHAVARGAQLAAEGADIIDIGGESTRPGAVAPTVEQELDRVIPVIRQLSTLVTTPLSVDTSRPAVMRAAVEAGVGLINDVRALTEPDAVAIASELAVPVCLVHMQGAPATMQDSPRYADVTIEVINWLADRLRVCREYGIPDGDLLVDPGFGFGKDLQHNLTLLAQLDAMRELRAPVVVGLSRKRLIGQITGRPVRDRVIGSVTAAILAVERGAAIVRVHDVAATREALAVLGALSETEQSLIVSPGPATVLVTTHGTNRPTRQSGSSQLRV